MSKFCESLFFMFNFDHYTNSELTFLEQDQYNRRRAGISSAIAISVLVPFMICAGCFLVKMRENLAEKYQNYRSGSSAPVQTRFVNSNQNANNDLNQNGAGQLADDTKGAPGGRKAPSKHKHEGEYYTNEPLDMYTRN